MSRRIAHAFRNGYSIGCIGIFALIGVMLAVVVRAAFT